MRNRGYRQTFTRAAVSSLSLDAVLRAQVACEKRIPTLCRFGLWQTTCERGARTERSVRGPRLGPMVCRYMRNLDSIATSEEEWFPAMFDHSACIKSRIALRVQFPPRRCAHYTARQLALRASRSSVSDLSLLVPEAKGSGRTRVYVRVRPTPFPRPPQF